MTNTKIQWTEKTWNPVTGCTKFSQGCVNCYAEGMAKRLQGMGIDAYKNGFKLTLHADKLDEPKKIKKPSMFFVCSMADIFHKDVPFEFIEKVMDTIEACPQHTFQLLTKRAQRMFEFFSQRRPVPQNAWVGVTMENKDVLERIDILRQTPCQSVRFLSCEPLLSDLGDIDLKDIDWVIVGGESGPNARPMEKDWVLNIKKQCEKQSVAFFFKQWGTYGEDGVRRDKKANGSLLDGETYQKYPQISK